MVGVLLVVIVLNTPSGAYAGESCVRDGAMAGRSGVSCWFALEGLSRVEIAWTAIAFGELQMRARGADGHVVVAGSCMFRAGRLQGCLIGHDVEILVRHSEQRVLQIDMELSAATVQLWIDPSECASGCSKLPHVPVGRFDLSGQHLAG